METQPMMVPILFVGKFVILRESILRHVTVRTEVRTLDLARLPVQVTPEARFTAQAVPSTPTGYEVSQMLVGAVIASAPSLDKLFVHFAKLGIVAVMLSPLEGVNRPSRRGAITDASRPGSSEDLRQVTVPWTTAKTVRDVGTLTGWNIPSACPENAVRPCWKNRKVEITMEVPVEIIPVYEGQPDYSFVLREVRAAGTQTSTVGYGEINCMSEEAMLMFQKVCVGALCTRNQMVATAAPIDLDRAYGQGQEAMLRFLQPTVTWRP
jgi:hypothetical protein